MSVTSRRLAILTNVPTPYRTAFFNALGNNLNMKGCSLHVLYCALRESHRSWEIDLESHHYNFKILPGFTFAHRGISFHVNTSVLTELRSLRPDWLVCAGSWNMPTALIASHLWVRNSAPVIFWSEGHRDSTLHLTGPVAYLRRVALRAYDAFAVPNQRAREYVDSQLKSAPPIIRLPNTVDEGVFSPTEAKVKLRLRRDLGIPLKNTVFVCVAQMEPRKGVMELLEAFVKLPALIREQTSLLFVGDGSLRTQMQAKVGSYRSLNVIFTGNVNQSILSDYLHVSDAFVLPTKSDPNPISPIEAAFSALPLIVSCRAGNVDELIPNRSSGYVLDSVDPLTISKALEDFVRLAPDKRVKMGIASRARALEEFALSATVDRFVADLFQVLCIQIAQNRRLYGGPSSYSAGKQRHRRH